MKIEKLNPKRYLFFTSQSLSPKKSDELAEMMVNDRISELDESDPSERTTEYKPRLERNAEEFGDDDLKSLFSNLIT